MHSVFADRLNLSQVKDWGTQIHKIQYYIAEKTLLDYIGGDCTLSYYFTEVNAALLLCWAMPKIIALLRYTLPQYIAGLCPILTQCWGESNLITLLSDSQFSACMSYTES